MRHSRLIHSPSEPCPSLTACTVRALISAHRRAIAARLREDTIPTASDRLYGPSLTQPRTVPTVTLPSDPDASGRAPDWMTAPSGTVPTTETATVIERTTETARASLATVFGTVTVAWPSYTSDVTVVPNTRTDDGASVSARNVRSGGIVGRTIDNGLPTIGNTDGFDGPDRPSRTDLLRAADDLLRDAADAADDPATADDLRALVSKFHDDRSGARDVHIPATAPAEWERLTAGRPDGTTPTLRRLGAAIHYDDRRPVGGTIVRADDGGMDLRGVRLVRDRAERSTSVSEQVNASRRVTEPGPGSSLLGTVWLTHPDGTTERVERRRPGRPTIGSKCTDDCSDRRHSDACRARKRRARQRAERAERADRAPVLTPAERARGKRAVASRTM